MKTLRHFLVNKRMLGILLGLTLLASLLVPATAIFAGTNPVQLYMNPATVTASSGTVSVPIYITNSVGLTGWGMDVYFDSTKLTFTNAVEGSSLLDPAARFGIQSAVHSGSPTYVTLGDAKNDGTASGINSTGILLVTLNFSVVSGVNNVAVPITMQNNQCTDASLNIVAADLTGGTVNVGTPPVQQSISSFTPTTGAAGQSVVINGSGFTGTTTVKFGGATGTSAASFTVNSDTQITAVVGLGVSGSIYLDNGTYNTTSTGTFTYSTTPTVASFSPASTYAGQTVTINGTGFIDTVANTIVKFGATNAVSFVINSTQQITATVGVGSTGFITVQTLGGTATSSTSFTYVAAAIASFSPTTAYTGDRVTINGSGFTGATAVSFGGTAASSYTVVSDNVITAIVANGASGIVSVTAPSSGSAITKTGFTYAQVALFITPSYQSLTTGGESSSATLNINTDGSKQIRMWQTDITFDPSKIQVTSVIDGTFFTAFVAANTGSQEAFGSVVIDNINGTITHLYNGILGASEAGGVTGTGTLATINFTAKLGIGGTSSISISNPSLADNNAYLISPITSVNATITQTQNIDSTTPVDAGLGAQLTFISPVPVSGWNLIVGLNNVQRTMNVFANTNWQVTVSADNSGHMTKYTPGNPGIYTTGTQLADPLSISSDSGNGGTGNSVNLFSGGVLATGTNVGQNQANGGDIRGLMLNQTVTYTDSIVTSPNTYHIVVTFTASAVY